MLRSKVCLLALALLSTGFGYKAYQLIQLERDFEAYKSKVAVDTAEANKHAAEVIRNIARAYSSQLEAYAKNRQQLSRAYNKALIDIAKAKKSDEDFKRWADERLPTILVERLRHLRAGGKDESRSSLSRGVPSAD